MENYYGIGRRRNLDINHHHQQSEQLHTVEEGVELEEGFEYEEVMDHDDEPLEEDHMERNQLADMDNAQDKQMLINGKPFVNKKILKKHTFTDTHVRITTYLEKNVNQIIRMLHKQGQIESITGFINDSIKDHLMNNYHNDN